jgi:signal transduction histidine kinase
MFRDSRSKADDGDEPSLPVPLVWAAWTVPALLSTLETVMFSGMMGGPPIETWRAFASQAPGWYTWALLTPMIVGLARRFPLEPPLRPRAVLAHVSGWLVVAVTASVVWAAVGTWLRPSRFGFVESVRNWFLSGLPFTVLGYAAVVGICYTLTSRARARKRERDAERLARQLSEAQLAALRSQLQPHFLFNSLNAIVALVRDVETDRAVSALSLLSDILRATLRTGAAHQIPLGQEVAFTRDYLELERLRFGKRLAVSFDVPPDLLDAAVPTFVLQPFVENAIKHGLMDRRQGGSIRVRAERDGGVLQLTVTDDGVGLSSDGGEGKGVGISNARSRLERMYGGAASLSIGPGEGGGVTVCVRLPYERLADAVEPVRGATSPTEVPAGVA